MKSFFAKPSILLYTLILFSGLISWVEAQRMQAPLPRVGIPVIRPTIVATIPHDTEAFTQGLLYRDGYLYESTGIVGRSSLRKIDASTGEVVQLIPVAHIFGEGIAVWEDELVQLTWKSNIAIRYTFPRLQQKGAFRYEGEGWGLTTDENGFIMSNGSDTLYFRNSSFEIYRTLPVTLEARPLGNLNELSYARDRIFANVWKENYIAEIDPQSGRVLRLIDCSALVRNELPLGPQQVLNGIAWCEEQDLWYLTGKEWQHIYLVTLEQ